MFRGGDYIDRKDFYNKGNAKPQTNSLQTNDIDGAQPKRRFGSRDSNTMSQAGAQVLDGGQASRIYA